MTASAKDQRSASAERRLKELGIALPGRLTHPWHSKVTAIHMSDQKTAILTGAGRGTGAGLVEAFLKEGYNVVGTSLSAHHRLSNRRGTTGEVLHVDGGAHAGLVTAAWFKRSRISK